MDENKVRELIKQEIAAANQSLLAEVDRRFVRMANLLKANAAKTSDTKAGEGRLQRDFYEIQGKSSFCKFKANAFEIDKLLVDFVAWNATTGKAMKTVSYYIDIDKALILANDILTGRIDALLTKSKEDFANSSGSSKRIKPVWEQLGGNNEEVAKAKGIRTDGKAQSRSVSITAGEKAYCTLSAQSGPGNTNERGLIVPEYANSETFIVVGANAELLKGMALKIQSEWAAFLADQYQSGKFLFSGDYDK